MKALSIRQPWAWLILNAGKDVENRDWWTHVRGTIAVHASKGMTVSEYDDVVEFLETTPGIAGIALPDRRDLQLGGFVGTVDIIDCTTVSDSPWFFGKHGFVLRNPQPRPFVPFRGSLGFFNTSANYK